MIKQKMLSFPVCPKGTLFVPAVQLLGRAGDLYSIRDRSNEGSSFRKGHVRNVQDHFFFQAGDGIRDKLVTGVQTCALPISPLPVQALPAVWQPLPSCAQVPLWQARSEERRVGKERRSRWSPDPE